jgi:hypothetical protein
VNDRAAVHATRLADCGRTEACPAGARAMLNSLQTAGKCYKKASRNSEYHGRVWSCAEVGSLP